MSFFNMTDDKTKLKTEKLYTESDIQKLIDKEIPPVMREKLREIRNKQLREKGLTPKEVSESDITQLALLKEMPTKIVEEQKKAMKEQQQQPEEIAEEYQEPEEIEEIEEQPEEKEKIEEIKPSKEKEKIIPKKKLVIPEYVETTINKLKQENPDELKILKDISKDDDLLKNLRKFYSSTIRIKNQIIKDFGKIPTIKEIKNNENLRTFFVGSFLKGKNIPIKKSSKIYELHKNLMNKFKKELTPIITSKEKPRLLPGGREEEEKEGFGIINKKIKNNNLNKNDIKRILNEVMDLYDNGKQNKAIKLLKSLKNDISYKVYKKVYNYIKD